ncbi:Virginiamycin B lyase [Rosistilla carotiformis]|uniref:Virginiamycin B lyase n=2 Tax=Rosistilla carotiformis TaxID=2528017 RepID=A0A518JQ72_9BACT|nr:Virginiamycin B lyase [Rosistilla carotiformis]
MKYMTLKTLLCATLVFSVGLVVGPASAVQRIEGRVAVAGGSIGNAEVTLWETTSEAPRKISATRTSQDGSFELSITDGNAEAGVYYLIAMGGVTNEEAEPNPSITLMTTLGPTPPDRVTINELTTIASAYTTAQFLHDGALRGNATGLRIAAGNVPNLVDLETGAHGPVIVNALNGPRTTTLAKFNTLGALLSACISGKPRVCEKLFEATTTPDGSAPSNTLSAMHNIARFPAHNATRIFDLFEALAPVPDGKRYRDVAFIPYLFHAPSAWTLSLVYAGGGFYAVGGAAIDGEGNFWTNNNWMPGSQTTIYQQFGGGEGKFAPNGKPLSPMITGFNGGGIDSPGWGIAFSSDDKVWVTNLIGRTISVLDRRTGKALSPEGGYNFDGKLGQMQGVLVAPNGDVWTVDNENNQIVHIPGGDISKGRILGRTVEGKPVDGTLQVKGPFGIAIDQQDRIWITNSASNTVTRFPASNPGQAEEFEVGFSPHAIAIDSKGNAWIGNLIGHPKVREKLALIKQKFEGEIEARKGSMTPDDVAANMWADLWEIINEYPGGDISMITPDGKVHGPFNADGAITGPWGIAIDGNDNVWVASSTSSSVTQLAGVRPETRPPGVKTGDPLTPHEGYLGGLQVIAPIAVDPAGNVWVGNGFHDTKAGFSKIPPEARSTQFGAHTIVVFFGVAKPVKPPLIGPVRGF